MSGLHFFLLPAIDLLLMLGYSVDTDRDGWIQINYEQFMKVAFTRSSDEPSFLTQSNGLDRAQRSMKVHF